MREEDHDNVTDSSGSFILETPNKETPPGRGVSFDQRGVWSLWSLWVYGAVSVLEGCFSSEPPMSNELFCDHFWIGTKIFNFWNVESSAKFNHKTFDRNNRPTTWTKLTFFWCIYTHTRADYHSIEQLLQCIKSEELPDPKLYTTTSIYSDCPLQTSRPTPHKTSATATGTYPTRCKTTTSTLLTASTASPRRLLRCQQRTCRQTALWSISSSWSPGPRYRCSHSRGWWCCTLRVSKSQTTRWIPTSPLPSKTTQTSSSPCSRTSSRCGSLHSRSQRSTTMPFWKGMQTGCQQGSNRSSIDHLDMKEFVSRTPNCWRNSRAVRGWSDRPPRKRVREQTAQLRQISWAVCGFRTEFSEKRQF